MLFIVNSRSVWGSKWREGHEEQKSVLCSGVAFVCLVLIFFCFLFLEDKNNRSFPNYLWPLFQSESWCSSFHMKISFHLHVNGN